MNNNTETMNEINILNHSKRIAKVRIMRDGLGVKIYFKSKLFHDLFKSYSQDMTRHSRWQNNNIKNYDISAFTSDALFLSTSSTLTPKMEYSRKNMNRAISNWGTDELVYLPNYISETCCPNIAWLAAKGTDKGITIIINRPMSNRAYKLYVKEVGVFMKFIYEQFLKPEDRTITLTIDYEPKKGKRLANNIVKPIVDDPILNELAWQENHNEMDERTAGEMRRGDVV